MDKFVIASKYMNTFDTLEEAIKHAHDVNTEAKFTGGMEFYVAKVVEIVSTDSAPPEAA